MRSTERGQQRAAFSCRRAAAARRSAAASSRQPLRPAQRCWASALPTEAPGFPAAYTASVGGHAFERTPKLWRAAAGERVSNTEAIRKLRLITAIKTPYLPDGRIDLFAFDSLVEQQIAAGVEGLIIGGTTGEGHLMSWDEHIMLIAHTCVQFGDRLAVIGNTGSNATREAVHATCQGFAVGMAAALHINPYYGKTSRAGLIYHFQAVLDYGPCIVYNVPGRTGQDIPSDVVRELSTHPNFAGIKECTGNDRIRAYSDAGVVCWSGNDDEAHDARWGCGAVGVISVTSNVVPGLMRSLMFDGRNDGLNARLQPLMSWLFAQPNPIGVNTALAMLGAAQPVFRLPYAPYDEPLRAQGAAILRELGLQHCVRPQGGDRSAPAQLIDSPQWKLLERY